MTQHIQNVVLVHGAFADGSGWEAVANILKDDGYKVSMVQHPETSYADDQKYTKAAIDAMDGRVVLVGHSYGGSVITEAGNHPKVRALVYIAAFALDEGEICASIEQALPKHPRRSTTAATLGCSSRCGDWSAHAFSHDSIFDELKKHSRERPEQSRTDAVYAVGSRRDYAQKNGP